MTVRTQNVAVTDTATRLDLGGDTDGIGGYTINATNDGPNVVTYGGADVVAGTGDTIPVDGRLSEQVGAGYSTSTASTEQVWAVCATGETATVRVTIFGA